MRLIALAAFALAAPIEAPRAAEMTGAATPLILALCEALPPDANGGASRRCPGVAGVDAFVEGENQVSLGSRGGADSFGPAAVLGKTMEWRLGLDGRPFAGILRYTIPANAGEGGGTVLSVVTVGTAERPGCRVAVIDTTVNPDASSIAQRIADERAPRFRCGVNKPELVGIASTWAQETILPALR